MDPFNHAAEAHTSLDKVREPQPGHGVMSRDIINNGGGGFTAGAGNDNPTSDFSGAASKRVRIEFKEMT